VPLDIFIPFWGDPALLETTVRSVLAQDSDDWVLTVVDDAYPDPRPRAFVEGLDDPRVRYVRHETNVGITENYRSCVALATHDHVVLLGCDDVLLPSYVRTVLEAHARVPEASVVQPGVEVIDADGTVVRPLGDVVKARLRSRATRHGRLLSGEALASSLLQADWLYWPSLSFRRDALTSLPFRDGMPIIQDLAIMVDLVLAGGSLLVEPRTCFQYRRHASSASSAKAFDGSRFAGERGYFTLAARLAGAKGWRRAERAARWHLTSRLHALTLVPGALRARGVSGLRPLLRHAFVPLRTA
jgi:glycosyltransferase involved in cell wall biosynthesis